MTSKITWAQLRDVNCAELEGAADGWGRASNLADTGRDRIDKQLLNGLRGTQQGEAADAAVGRLRQLSRNFQYVYTECGLLRTTLNSMAHEIKGQQRALQEALDDAEALKFTVHPDGSVTYPEAGEGLIDGKPMPGGTATGGGVPGLLPPSGLVAPNPNVAKAQDIADRVAKALRTAADIDWRYTRILRKLKAEEGLKVPDSTWTDAATDAAAVRNAAGAYLNEAIPHDASPAERKAWWAGLTEEQREEYLAVYPDQIGNLDGIPAVVRDAANRDNLQLLIGKLEGQEGERAETQLAGLREIDRQLHDGRKPPMFLLGIGDEGNGRAIVSYGNPDTARNVSAYVPGLNTSLDEEFAKGDLKRAWDTAKGTNKYDHSSAAIVWLGYDAPQTPDGLGSLAVMGNDRAERGGSAFNDFMGGLVATNENEDPHLTAIGHSYGSRTVGAATQQGGGIPGVDDIVLVGSPGVGVDHAEDLGVGKDHVFVGAAENDVVTKLPSKQQAAVGVVGLIAGGPSTAYVAGDLADPGDDDLWFGKDPASEAFGARRFPVGEGPRLISGHGFSIDAHSQYFDPKRNAVSADSIALIAAGRSEKVKMEESR
ncbi:alpha/beta hydrolase family protein [Streptomyces sp. NBC_00841]|uniref:alpha/beta hydrolase n=1 Tax=unclassified Streptomyces TaxID=2593676 RepID=UPI00225259CD|nr:MULTISPECIES: alpha/beta hydrolase [unclassified Streptomyces]MCX4533731.1 alpha/beta hydrolase family protein [Streptomyces sp. NBC_01669]WSA00871.1 alpha/beta hydrolase family protein [Streptomyces sp. NBC_00841]